jgi:hypothetical protein
MIILTRSLVFAIVVMLPAAAFGWTSGPGEQEIKLAYIDPGAGSFVIQALVAALAGIAVTGRLYWSKIKVMLGMGSVDEDDEDAKSDDD